MSVEINNTQPDIIKEEYIRLTAELLEFEKDLHASERLGSIGYFSAYALVLFDPDKSFRGMDKFIWWVPAFIMIVVDAKTLITGMRMNVIGAYLRIVEKKHIKDKDLGWESHMQSNSRWSSYAYLLSSLFLYLGLLLASVAAALIQSRSERVG